MVPRVENLISTKRELNTFKNLVETIISSYEEDSGTYLSDLYARVDNIESVEELQAIVDSYWGKTT